MSEPTTVAPKPQNKPTSPSRALQKKLGLVALIFGLLQAPLFLITEVIEERKMYNVDYSNDYKGAGAGQQTITGPILTVPYKYQITEEKEVASAESVDPKKTPGKPTIIKVTQTVTGNLHFFPEDFNVSGNLLPELRDEGKFKNILYSTELDMKGTFNTTEIAKKKINEKDLLWDDAFIGLGVSDLRGITKETSIKLDGRQYKFVPGTNGLKVFDAGQAATISGLQKPGVIPFSMSLVLKGSRYLNVFPAGKTNKISLSSSWKDPTFTGGFLPTLKSMSSQGFSSLWEVSYFSRNLPQVWTDEDPDISNSLAQYMVGVELATPVEFYQTTVRAVKYGSLFIVLTFLTFFIFEMIAQVRIHELQYLLIGLALSIFFLLLIGISEWLPFTWAYVLASVPTIAQVTWYTKEFSKTVNKSLWKVMAVTQVILYTYLYVLLQMENFSMLVGAIGLFLALSVVMYVIRNFNWYNEELKSPS